MSELTPETLAEKAMEAGTRAYRGGACIEDIVEAACAVYADAIAAEKAAREEAQRLAAQTDRWKRKAKAAEVALGDESRELRRMVARNADNQIRRDEARDRVAALEAGINALADEWTRTYSRVGFVNTDLTPRLRALTEKGADRG